MAILRRSLAVLALSSLATAACGGPDPKLGSRNELSDKWFQRAQTSFKHGDMDDAATAVEEAVKITPKDEETRILAARIAITDLDYPRVLKHTEGLESTEAHMLRGRAFWYAGDIERARGELETMLKDPEAKDPWAREVVKLTRSGRGRKPFHMDGGIVSAVEMPTAGSLLIVPCELDGENILAVAATGVAELTIDAATRKEPAWVSLRFGDLEVKDVPAVTQDLSALSKQLGAPIKALLGVNVLRHLHVTFDRRGSQFVVRRDEPGAPPDASRVRLHYVRGGGMLMTAHMSQKAEAPTSFLVDTSQPFPLALFDETWTKAGVNPASLKSDPSLPANLKAGYIPYMRVGAFELPQIPAVQGMDLRDIKSRIDIDFGGVVGAGLLSAFRVTFGDQGRFIWLESDPGPLEGTPDAAQPGAQPAPGAQPGAQPPAAVEETPAKKPAAKPAAKKKP
ncbi:MAG: hypothetical protein EOP08_03005 [Proteobacteria bacterium]|nr:MAG: hypothetical protein EOP08_03005 [Pseudomonadota bacterium]